MVPKLSKGSMMQKAGSLAFIVGVIIAVLAGFWQLTVGVTSLLIVMGLLVGFLNVTSSESRGFLFTTLVLVVVGNMGGEVLGKVQVIGLILQNVLNAIVIFVIPATIIVAFREIYSYAHNS